MRMSIELVAKRGRPPTYERRKALAAITEAFWTNGYASTSLDDLAAATGMVRPSLYAAFGDKRAMYLAALGEVRGMIAAELDALTKEPDLEVALRTFYARAIEAYLSGGAHPRGCLAICTATVAATAHQDIRAELHDIIAAIDHALEARIAASLPDTSAARAHAKATALLASATLHSLAIRARAGFSRDELVSLANAAFYRLPAKTSKKTS